MVRLKVDGGEILAQRSRRVEGEDVRGANGVELQIVLRVVRVVRVANGVEMQIVMRIEMAFETRFGEIGAV